MKGPRWFPVFRPQETRWDRNFNEVLRELDIGDTPIFSREAQRRLALLLAFKGCKVWDTADASKHEERREAVQCALAAALIVISISLEESEVELFLPLEELFCALSDIDAGVVAPYLQSQRLHPVATDKQREFKTSCVRVVLLLGKAKLHRSEARKCVGRRLSAKASTLGLTIGASTLKNWQAAYEKETDPFLIFDRLQWEGIVAQRLRAAIDKRRAKSPSKPDTPALFYKEIAEELISEVLRS